MEYMFDNPAYPIVHSRDEILPALREAFTRAVILRDPALTIDASTLSVSEDIFLAHRYGGRPQDPNRLYAGSAHHDGAITAAMVNAESKAAKIDMGCNGAESFAAKCNDCREIFRHAVEDYTGTPLGVRSRLLFTPIGGHGRAEEVHVDNTILTLHWAAGLSTLSMANGEPDQELWSAMDKKRLLSAPFSEQIDLSRTLRIGSFSPGMDYRDNQIGDVVIGKGQRFVDMADVEVRKAMFIHRSSRSVERNGQAALVLTPIHD